MITPRNLALTTLLLVAAAGTCYEARLASGREIQLGAQRKKVDRLLAQVRQAQAERDRAQSSAEAAPQEPATEPALDPSTEAWLAHLALCSPSTQLSVEARAGIWLENLHRLKQTLAQRPDQQIPELALLTDRDWLQIAQSAVLSNDDFIRSALADLRASAKETFASRVREALQKYTQASGGELPADPAQLSAFGDPPLDPAMLARYAMSRTGKVDSINEMLVVEKSPVNNASEGRLSVSLSGSQTETETTDFAPTLAAADPPTTFVDVSPALSQDLQQELAQATAAYIQAHNGQMPAQLDPEELRPYVKDPAKLDEFLRVLKAEAGKRGLPGG